MPRRNKPQQTRRRTMPHDAETHEAETYNQMAQRLVDEGLAPHTILGRGPWRGKQRRQESSR